MRFVSFFAGIGGFDLGLERAGHECVGQVEIDPYAIRVLERHWPDVPRFGDIRTLAAASLPDADLWCGGFPCQPYSRANVATRGHHHAAFIWPAFACLVRTAKPKRLLLENVAAIRAKDGGLERVVYDLAESGYVGSWASLRSDEFGAPFKGERIYIAATYCDGESDQSEHDEVAVLSCFSPTIRDWPDSPDHLGMDDGFPGRTHRNRLVGNAVVPQVVEAIARKVWG